MFKIIAVNQLEESRLANKSILEIILPSKYWDKGKKKKNILSGISITYLQHEENHCTVPRSLADLVIPEAIA